jgi:transglutaminase-like putative cysteine protease
LAFALILNANTSSAATVNGTSSMNSSVNTVSALSTTSKVTSTAVKTTDVTKPKVKVIDPVNGSVNVKTTKTINITFSEKIKAGTLWIELKNSKSQNIPIKTAISGSILYINPVKTLTSGMTYYIILHANSVKDLAGNSVNLQSYKFTTIPTAYVKYLNPSQNCQSTNSKIKSLAASITKGKTSEYSKASAIFNWVRDHISYSFYYNTRKGAVGTLNSRSANCADTAHLMVALERAAGIAARYNHGTCRFSSGHYYGHVWAQVYVNGKWYYADGTSSRNSFGIVKNWNTKNFSLHGIYASLPF